MSMSTKNFENTFDYEGEYISICAQGFIKRIVDQSQIIDENSPIGSILIREFPEILKNSIDSVRNKKRQLINRLETLTDKRKALEATRKDTQTPIIEAYARLLMELYKEESM